MDFAPAWIPISAFIVFVGTITRVYDDRIDKGKRRRTVLAVCALCVGVFAILVIASPSLYHVLWLVLLIVLLAAEYETISRRIIK